MFVEITRHCNNRTLENTAISAFLASACLLRSSTLATARRLHPLNQRFCTSYLVILTFVDSARSRSCPKHTRNEPMFVPMQLHRTAT